MTALFEQVNQRSIPWRPHHVHQVLLEVLDDDFSSWSCSTALEALRSCCDAELLETRALRHLLKLLKTKSKSLVKCAALKARCYCLLSAWDRAVKAPVRAVLGPQLLGADTPT